MDVGKLPLGLLSRYVLPRLGAPAAGLAVPPAPGHDACALRLGEGYLVVASDPALGAPPEHLGRLAVLYSASDVAVLGAEPRWLVSDILLPPGSGEGLLDALTSQLDEASRELGIAIIGGHSGCYPAMAGPVVVTTAFGPAERVLSPAAIRPGMRVLLAKGLGAETACYLAWARRDRVESLLGRRRAGALRAHIREEGCVAEALLLREWSACMHDLTEGGLLGALDELRAATGLGADIREEALPVDEDVASVLRAFSIDPLSASSTGSLIAFCPARAARRALGALAESGVAAADIGAVTRGRVRLVDPRGGARAAQAGEDGYARFAARRHAGRGPRGVRTSPAGPPRRGRPRPGR